jgi:hypothetical protein
MLSFDTVLKKYNTGERMYAIDKLMHGKRILILYTAAAT